MAKKIEPRDRTLKKKFNFAEFKDEVMSLMKSVGEVNSKLNDARFTNGEFIQNMNGFNRLIVKANQTGFTSAGIKDDSQAMESIKQVNEKLSTIIGWTEKDSFKIDEIPENVQTSIKDVTQIMKETLQAAKTANNKGGNGR